MPLPLILGIGAGVAAATGIGTGIHGGVKMKHASDTLKQAQKKHDEAVKRFETSNVTATEEMDKLGKKELEICSEFQKFADLIEKIQGRPEFKDLNVNYVDLPTYNEEELKRVSVGASVLVGSLGGATAGVAGGFAAAGITTSAVMALGTASTGTAIASLSGAAATNATLAVLGGGTIAAGGGGMALGSTILGASTLGVGLMVGGIIFSVTGSNLSKKADEAYYQALEIERNVSEIVPYLTSLKLSARKYYKLLDKVNRKYEEEFAKMQKLIMVDKKVQWKKFSEKEKEIVENNVLLVGLLYKMCSVNLVLQDSDGDGKNTINSEGIGDCMRVVEVTMNERFAA